MDNIAVLDSEETATVIAQTRNGVGASDTAKIARALDRVVDTDQSVFVAGMNESLINSVRTRMYRRNVKVTVRKAERDGTVGHILIARSVE